MNPSLTPLTMLWSRARLKPLQGPALGRLALAGHDHAGAVDLSRSGGAIPIQLPLGLRRGPSGPALPLHLGGDGDGLFSNA